MSPGYTFVRRVVRLLALSGLACIVVAGPAVAQAGKAAIVRGVAWNSDNSPLVNARIRLRDIETGRVASTAETADGGRFSFSDVSRGSYVVELVSDSGKVLAVGQRFRTEPGETVSTFVQLPSRKPWIVGMFSNTAAVVIAAASTVGLTALGAHDRPVSPQ